MEGDNPLIDARNNRLPDKPALEPTRLSSHFEVGVAFEAFRFVFDLTARTANRLNPKPLCSIRGDYQT